MPTNELHTSTDIEHVKTLLDEKRLQGDAIFRAFVNEKDHLGRAPIHSLMRLGASAREVIIHLISLQEVNVNAIEDKSGVTIAHLCEDGDIMLYLATQRLDFNPNVVNPRTGSNALEYGVSYPKHAYLTQCLLKCPNLLIDENKIKQLIKTSTNPISLAALFYIKQEIDKRKAAQGNPVFIPGDTPEIAQPNSTQAHEVNSTQTSTKMFRRR